MKRVLLQPAYVLHRRSYRETSFLVELFTPEHGRLTVVAIGVLKPRSAAQGLLQPFVPLLVSFTGKGELMSLIELEANGVMQHLQGDCLFAGFYLNELLMKLLQKWDAHPRLYTVYEKTLAELQSTGLQEKTLRLFEKSLLEELGYGLLPTSVISLHNTFSPEKYYRFIPEQGFVLCDEAVNVAHHAKTGNIFSGKNLIALARENWEHEDCLFDAKRLMRFVLAPLLGDKPLYSRRLFMQPLSENKNDES
jgi:DNA repair protein RecO (recombination protein O)